MYWPPTLRAFVALNGVVNDANFFTVDINYIGSPQLFTWFTNVFNINFCGFRWIFSPSFSISLYSLCLLLTYNSCRRDKACKNFFLPTKIRTKINKSSMIFLLLNVKQKVDWNLTFLFVANYAFVFLLHTVFCFFFIFVVVGLHNGKSIAMENTPWKI